MRHSTLLLFLLILLLACSKSIDPQTEDCGKTTIQVSIQSITPPTNCGSQDGKVTFQITGGVEPYVYNLNTGSTIISQTSSVYNNLFPGSLTLTVKDKFQCNKDFTFELRLSNLSGISYSTQIKPILDTNCNLSACHDGSLGADRDWRNLNAIKNKLNNFQRILSLKKMPPPPNTLLSDVQTNLILCWIADNAPNN